jgi:ATP-dependent HslUV protease subunit HslV
MEKLHGTTIIAVKRNNKTVIAGDGQVTLGETVMKGTARKVRKIGNGKVISGFAGSVADAITLLDKFEEKYSSSNGILIKAAANLAKEWRTSKVLRNLEAMLIVADTKSMLVVSGNGEVIQPDEDIIAIGSGGSFALAAAKALIRNTEKDARTIALESMKIASEICIYTNGNIIYEELEVEDD